jgi:hypothetical protein
MKTQTLSFCAVLSIAAVFCLCGLIINPFPAVAQGSLTSGDVTGTIEDPTGAAVPNAKVTLTNKDTGATQISTSNGTGAYHFSLLNPGNYTISAEAQGFQVVTSPPVRVALGQTQAVNLKLQIGPSSTTVVEVNAGGTVLQTENANVSTNVSPEQIANVPNPGNDLTYFAQTSPGATMNTQAGYGNQATFGISGTSNLFTENGMDENDPFLNVNNSGASNLLLGANDIQEATVVNNGFSGQYGELAGMNVNFVSKSGTNNFHGNLEYFWNGDVLDGNGWFNDHTVPKTPRPFVNDNQWAASIGGPLVKNKTFFFADTEGLRLLIPVVGPVNVPSPQFEAATLANLTAVGNAAEIPFYNKIFSIYNGASGYSSAANVLPAGGCDGGVALPGGAPCALQFQESLHNLTDEWLLTTRFDQQFSNSDHVFVHFRTDHGLQATYTDPLNPILNTQSRQPQYDGQIQWNHTVGATGTNQLIIAGLWYSAVFAPPSLTAATTLIPYSLTFSGGELYSPGGVNYSTWPQGRNVTQYQVEDNYAWQKGKHGLKFGVDFRRNDITDYAPGGFNNTIQTAIFANLGSFYGGTVDTFEQSFATRATEPLAVYNLDFYAQDDVAVTSNLKVNLALRAEHNSNPICVTNCFARLTGDFNTISHDPSQPYNQAIASGLHQALRGYQNIAWEPRVGFAWQPLGHGSTVIRGGVGMFADIFPALLSSSFDSNSPTKNTFITSGLQLAPGLPGSSQTTTTADNAAFATGFASGQNIAQILSAAPTFTPPTITNAVNYVKYPTYYEWNFGIQQALGSKTAITLTYVGNHGQNLAVLNPAVNAFCNGPTTALPYQASLTGAGSCTSALGISSFAGLPTTPLDARFSSVSQAYNPGTSNYNGLVVAVTRHMSKSLQFQASYTWSHALDDVSNGGFLPFNFDTNTSILAGQNPYNLKQYNYGNSDYDSRQNFVGNYVYSPQLKGLLGDLLDWTISGTLFARTGYPFTPIDGGSTGILGSYNYGPTVPTTLALFPDSTVGPLSCSSSATTTPCLTAAQFPSAIVPGAVSTWGAQRRNQVYGPFFFDYDMALLKTFPIPGHESMKFEIGAQAFNLFNHPNFDQPVGNISNPQFGSILATVGTPTSIYGSFLGANDAPRAVQIKAVFEF